MLWRCGTDTSTMNALPLLLLASFVSQAAADSGHVALFVKPDTIVHNLSKYFEVSCTLAGSKYTSINEFSLFRDKKKVAVLTFKPDPSQNLLRNVPIVLDNELRARAKFTGSLTSNYINLLVRGPYPCCGYVRWQCHSFYVEGGIEKMERSRTKNLRIVATIQELERGKDTREMGALTFIDYSIIGTIAFSIIMYLTINRVDQTIVEVITSMGKEPMFKSYAEAETSMISDSTARMEMFKETPIFLRIQMKRAANRNRSLESIVASEIDHMTEMMERDEEKAKQRGRRDSNAVKNRNQYVKDHYSKLMMSQRRTSFTKGGYVSRQKMEWLMKNTSGLDRCNEEDLRKLLTFGVMSSFDENTLHATKPYVTKCEERLSAMRLEELFEKNLYCDEEEVGVAEKYADVIARIKAGVMVPMVGVEQQDKDELILKDLDGFILVNGARIPHNWDRFPMKVREMRFVGNPAFPNDNEESEFQVTEGDNFLVRFEYLDHGCILVAIKDEDLTFTEDKVIVPLDERFWVRTVLGKKFIPSICWGFHFRNDGFFEAEYSDKDLRRTRSGHRLIPFELGHMVRSVGNVSVPYYENLEAQSLLDAEMDEAVKTFGPEKYRIPDAAEDAILTRLEKMGKAPVRNPDKRKSVRTRQSIAMERNISRDRGTKTKLQEGDDNEMSSLKDPDSRDGVIMREIGNHVREIHSTSSVKKNNKSLEAFDKGTIGSPSIPGSATDSVGHKRLQTVASDEENEPKTPSKPSLAKQSSSHHIRRTSKSNNSSNANNNRNPVMV